MRIVWTVLTYSSTIKLQLVVLLKGKERKDAHFATTRSGHFEIGRSDSWRDSAALNESVQAIVVLACVR